MKRNKTKNFCNVDEIMEDKKSVMQPTENGSNDEKTPVNKDFQIVLESVEISKRWNLILTENVFDEEVEVAEFLLSM